MASGRSVTGLSRPLVAIDKTQPVEHDQERRTDIRRYREVLGELAMPEDAAAGPMHRLSRLKWDTWVRLSLIPAGGDWRDLPGMQAAVVKYHADEQALAARAHDTRSSLSPLRELRRDDRPAVRWFLLRACLRLFIEFSLRLPVRL